MGDKRHIETAFRSGNNTSFSLHDEKWANYATLNLN